MAKQGRLDHLPRYAEARAWMSQRADVVVDTTRLTPDEAADHIRDAVRVASGEDLAATPPEDSRNPPRGYSASS